MPDHLRINPKRHYRQTEQDEKIRSPESCNLAKRHSGASARRSEARSFSRSRCSFGHALCEITRARTRSEEHTSEFQSPVHIVCRLLLEKKKEHVYIKKSIHMNENAAHWLDQKVRFLAASLCTRSLLVVPVILGVYVLGLVGLPTQRSLRDLLDDEVT